MRAYLAALTLAMLILGTVEWRTDEDLVTLLVLATTSCGLGAMRPALFWVSAICLGCVVAALNVLTTLTGLTPIYESGSEARSHGLGYGLSLLVLAVPALLAAGTGAGLRRLIAGAGPSVRR